MDFRAGRGTLGEQRMTTEHLMLLEPSDFRAVRIQCGKCGASTSFQLDQTVKLPNRCVGCGEDWTPVHEKDSQMAAGRLVESLTTWTRTEREGNPTFKLTLELSPTSMMPKPPATHK